MRRPARKLMVPYVVYEIERGDYDWRRGAAPEPPPAGGAAGLDALRETLATHAAAPPGERSEAQQAAYVDALRDRSGGDARAAAEEERRKAALADAMAEAALERADFEETEPPPAGPDLRRDAEYVWYWEEDDFRVKRHRWDKRGNFVAYPPVVSAFLEARYAAATSPERRAADDVTVTYRPFGATAFGYRVDFKNMRQINRDTGYKRSIMRRKNPAFEEGPG